MLSIKDLNQPSLSILRFLRNISANTSLLFTLITIYYTNANQVLELTTPAKPSLSKFADEWLATMDKGLFTGVMIDLHKAFDIVDHKLLLKKLQVYGLNTNSLKWFQSYLSRRYQKVCVNGKLSEPLCIHYGVLQGSIILAFMPMTLYASALTLAEVEEKIKSDIDGMQLTKVESERVLGVYIDSHLIWNEHIDTLRRKLLQGIAILARAWKYISTKYQLLLYNASIKLLFNYC